MKFGAAGVLHTMHRPGAAVFREVPGCGWMPVAAFVNRSATLEKLINESIQWCDNFIASLYGKSAARTKVVLDVDDQQRLFVFSHGYIGFNVTRPAS